MPNVNPTDVGGSGQTRLIVEAVKESVAELKADVRTIRDHRFTDMMYHLAVLVGAGILLGGMMIAAYFKELLAEHLERGEFSCAGRG